MLKFPLKQKIILIFNNVQYVCKINFAGKDVLICNDVYQVLFNNETAQFEKKYISDKIVFERKSAIGYSLIINPVEIKTNKKIMMRSSNIIPFNKNRSNK